MPLISDIVTKGGRESGLRSLRHYFLGYFGQYFDGQNGIKSGCLNKMPGNVTEKSVHGLHLPALSL